MNKQFTVFQECILFLLASENVWAYLLVLIVKLPIMLYRDFYCKIFSQGYMSFMSLLVFMNKSVPPKSTGYV